MGQNPNDSIEFTSSGATLAMSFVHSNGRVNNGSLAINAMYSKSESLSDANNSISLQPNE